jgi:hypothetical protein
VIKKFLVTAAAALFSVLAVTLPGFSNDQVSVPEQIYPQLDHMLSLVDPETEFDQEKISGLLTFVADAPAQTSAILQERNHAAGAFFAFTIERTFQDLIGYAYNPDIPHYFTMPSSLQNHEWMTPETEEHLRRLANDITTLTDSLVLRGRERETITPDTNTGSYYSYTQDRVVVLMPGPRGPVMISATAQGERSDVGKRGCIVGNDTDWNYLYSQKTGLNKTGLGWVDSYMYKAYSVMVYVSDEENQTISAGSFKWLNAGWSRLNMVKSHHILAGIERFAADLKSVLESPDLPRIEKVADKYQQLKEKNDQELRRMVAPYLEKISSSEDRGTCPSSFISSVESGKYLEQMSNQELIRILMLRYLKNHIRPPQPDDIG